MRPYLSNNKLLAARRFFTRPFVFLSTMFTDLKPFKAKTKSTFFYMSYALHKTKLWFEKAAKLTFPPYESYSSNFGSQHPYIDR